MGRGSAVCFFDTLFLSGVTSTVAKGGDLCILGTAASEVKDPGLRGAGALQRGLPLV